MHRLPPIMLLSATCIGGSFLAAAAPADAAAIGGAGVTSTSPDMTMRREFARAARAAKLEIAGYQAWCNQRLLRLQSDTRRIHNATRVNNMVNTALAELRTERDNRLRAINTLMNDCRSRIIASVGPPSGTYMQELELEIVGRPSDRLDRIMGDFAVKMTMLYR